MRKIIWYNPRDMSNENRPELPEGYSWQECPGLQAAFPKPEGWFYEYDDIQGTRACFVTREQITTRANDWDSVAAGRGFRVGLSVNCLMNLQRRTGNSPGKFAKDALATNDLLVPEGLVERISQNPFVFYRGYFRSRMTLNGTLREVVQYMQSVGNIKTGSAYILAFETPGPEWTQYQDMAEVMIKNSLLSPNI